VAKSAIYDLLVLKMDSGRRTFVVHEDNFTAVRGSSLSHPLVMFPLSSAHVDDATGHVDDDIDWTIKYLASDQPRSPTFVASIRRLPLSSQ